jgi:hypothetical protein
MHAVSVEPQLLTRPQAAVALSVAESTLRRWYSEGRGPATVKLGTGRASRIRYPLEHLRAFALDPVGYDRPARADGLPHFEPPSRGNPRRERRAAK